MDNKLIKKNLENEKCFWWFRSADSNFSHIVGYVHCLGLVHSSYGYNGIDGVNDDSNYSAICLII